MVFHTQAGLLGRRIVSKRPTSGLANLRVEDLILEHVNFGSEYAKPVQMTKLLRDLGIKAPRMPDFKEASRVLHERGIEPRRSNGKKIYDLDYTPVEDDSIGSIGGNWND